MPRFALCGARRRNLLAAPVKSSVFVLHTKMYATPHWVDRRHGWEPVMKRDAMTMHAQHKAYKEIPWSEFDDLYQKLMKKNKAPLRFEYWKSKRNKQWYWRIRAGNAEPIAHGEGYKRRSGVLKVFHLLFNFEAQPDCVDVTPVKWGKLNRNWP